MNTGYRSDLEKMICPFGRVMFGDMTDPKSWRKELAEVGMTETAYFSLLAWLECLLQAVIHSYDRSNHEPYLKMVKIPVTAPACSSGFQGSLYPNKFLVGHEDWTKADLIWVVPAVETLLSSWYTQYEKVFGSESLKDVANGLQNDSQICFDTWEFEQPKFLASALSDLLGRDKIAA